VGFYNTHKVDWMLYEGKNEEAKDEYDYPHELFFKVTDKCYRKFVKATGVEVFGDDDISDVEQRATGSGHPEPDYFEDDDKTQPNY